jgi:tetraacyldisaccharide 4'-kinase
VNFWYRRSAVAWLLWPASLVFGFFAFIRRALYRLRILKSAHPGIPVIVVGNITVGGSGKTPLVIWIAELLKSEGWSPAVISRGYGAKVQAPRSATVASDPEEVGDEPIVIARRTGCPVWIGPRRVQVAAALRAQHPEVNVLVLDDGLQHYALRRDIEIAVVDARGFGNGFMLPAGPLREPVSRLRSIDGIVAHGAAIRGHSMSLEGYLAHRMTDARERRVLETFAGQKVHAAAGIGDPERFFRHLGRCGIQVIPHPFPDHHPFSARDLEFGDGLPVMLTEKDAVKLRSRARPNWWVLPVSAKLDPAFDAWLLGKLDELRRSKAA